MDNRGPPAGSPAGGDTSQPLVQQPNTIARERPLPLRQMGIGELLDAAIKLYRTEWKTLMLIVAIVLVPVSFIEAFATRTLPGLPSRKRRCPPKTNSSDRSSPA